MKNLLAFLFISFLMIAPSNMQAQVESTDSTLRLIEKNDGAKYIAKILSDDARELLIETETIGKIYILKSEVKRITLIENQDEINEKNAQTTKDTTETLQVGENNKILETGTSNLLFVKNKKYLVQLKTCLLYTSPSPRDRG